MACRLHVLALCAACLAAAQRQLQESGGVELPLVRGDGDLAGLFNAELSIGTPPQKLSVSVDSASSTLWVSGFAPAASSTFDTENKKVHLPPYADGLEVSGIAAKDTIMLGAASVTSAPLLVRDGPNATKPEDLGSSGIMGLLCPRWAETKLKDEVEPLFCEVWRQRPQWPQTFLLELGAEKPMMRIGVPLTEGSRETGEPQTVRFANNLFAARTRLWYTTLRGMALVTPGGPSFFSPPRSLSFDFNSALPTGVAALLDSGAAAIRVGTGLFNVFQAVLPGDCQRSVQAPHASLNCDCKSVEDFPTITFSFEAAGNTRFMGLDFGADFLSCMPASSYVTRKPNTNVCSIAIVDGGKQHTAFGVDAVVLGVPFFRSTTVGFDAKRQQLAIGPLAPPVEGAVSGKGGKACTCTDPKNWWSTGKRISFRRIGVCLGLVAGLAFYVFVMYSPSPHAESARTVVGGALARANGARFSRGSRLGGDGIPMADAEAAPGGRGRGRPETVAQSQEEGEVHSGFVPLNSDAEG